ncbi:interferon-induced protein 44-like [Saccostrea cucullata]|uniref:interferon-induced protein 44-like n=1 Tax=Saccostrea cuccullata TaxID=36930 RepID=UPI002ED11EFD
MRYIIRDSAEKKNLKFKICDTLGIDTNQTLSSKWMNDKDLGYMLDGNLPNQYTFNLNSFASEHVKGFVKNPTLQERTHVVCFVIDASNIGSITKGITDKLQQIKENVADRGIPHLIILTKIDLLCELVDHDASNAFVSEKIEMVVNQAAAIMKVPRNHVFPVKNYEKELHLQMNMNILALSALNQVLLFANDYLENQYQLQKESEHELNSKN